MVIDFICRQQQLHSLGLAQCKLSSAVVERLLNGIKDSPVLAEIRTLYIDESSFDTEEACQALMNVIAEAPKLSTISISNQLEGKKIKVDVQYATEVDGLVSDENKGKVTVSDAETGDVICETSTWKTEARGAVNVKHEITFAGGYIPQ